MTPSQFLNYWLKKHPVKSVPIFREAEVLQVMNDWNDHIAVKLKPNRREILDEANKQNDIHTRRAFSKGAQWYRDTQYRHEQREQEASSES